MQELTHPPLLARRVDWTPGSVMHALPDLALVRETKAGNQGAFGELIRRYQDKLYTIVHGMVPDREDALDLTQDIFIKAYEGLSRFREGSSFYTWLYRIAVNACIDFNRRRQRAVQPQSLSEGFLAEIEYEPADENPSSDPERMLANKELAARLREAIRTLPEPFRAAVLLRDVEGLPLNEIAEILKCPLGTVKTRLHRGRHELQQRLAPFLEGVEP